MDIREVILNKKHSLEMEELKTAHALAIGEWEKEVRDLKDYSQRIDQELDGAEGAFDEIDTAIHSQSFRTGAFYAMAGWCGGYSGDLGCDCFHYRDDHCVKIFAQAIIKFGGDFEKFKNTDSTSFIVKMLCRVNDWDMDQFLEEIEDEIKQTHN